MSSMWAVAFVGVLLAGCAIAPPPPTPAPILADLAAMDGCAGKRDAAYQDLRSTVGGMLHSSKFTLASAVGMMDTMAALSPGATFHTTRQEAEFLSQSYVGPGSEYTLWNIAKANRERLPAIRQCLTAKGYTFSERR